MPNDPVHLNMIFVAFLIHLRLPKKTKQKKIHQEKSISQVSDLHINDTYKFIFV
jgi:hypothetical protein